MSFLAYAGLTIFILILFAGIFLNFFGLPGTVVIFFDVLLYALINGFEHVGLKIILCLFILAAIAETIDFFWIVSETPQQQTTAPRKSVKAVFLGALIGAFLLTPFFWGPGMWIGFFLGGLAGILMMEIIRQYKLKAPYRTLDSVVINIIGKNAVKGFISLFMVAFSLSNIYS